MPLPSYPTVRFIGGLGCPPLQQLAAAGVGTITLVDGDTVDLSNIHRQILFGAGDIGKPKVEVAAARARELQPDIQINAVAERVRVDNVVELVGGVDLVLDGSDTFATKYLVADAWCCVIPVRSPYGIPVLMPMDSGSRVSNEASVYGIYFRNNPMPQARPIVRPLVYWG